MEPPHHSRPAPPVARKVEGHGRSSAARRARRPRGPLPCPGLVESPADTSIRFGETRSRRRFARRVPAPCARGRPISVATSRGLVRPLASHGPSTRAPRRRAGEAADGRRFHAEIIEIGGARDTVAGEDALDQTARQGDGQGSAPTATLPATARRRVSARRSATSDRRRAGTHPHSSRRVSRARRKSGWPGRAIRAVRLRTRSSPAPR
jgi:hypothetical protein